ncbi:predicted hydrolase/acyltransferase [Vibrio variabilis]|uniref:Predicted hydrolase/acyltransferase n=1 Tax=Vibrio variabilis TaxID=990271 RepID=A0ABQ0J4D7_9VIBR|nr:predicted hydrolase/acyltransferase [Vibrio variabilis]
MDSTFKEKSLKIDDRTIAYLEREAIKTTAKTVVFIHGWMDNAASFHALLALIEKQSPDWRVVAIDLPGHGHSSHKSPHHFYNFHDYIDDLHRILIKLHAVDVFLVGHSLGALIASCYSAAFPEKVSGLVQIEAHIPLSESPQLSAERLRKGIESRERWRGKTAKAIPSKQDAINMRIRATKLSESAVLPIVERDLRCEQGKWYWRHDSKLKCESVYRMAEQNAQAIVDAIQTPHLVILGERGYAYLQHKERLAMLPKAQIEWVAGDHHCHLESPESVFELILGLVNKN